MIHFRKVLHCIKLGVLTEIHCVLKLNNIQFSPSIDNLYLLVEKQLLPITTNGINLSDVTQIVVVDVVIPRNEYSFANVDGLKYFFHMDERNHLYYPHIHVKYVKYGEQEIQISLRNQSVKGSFRNHKKNKQAIEYIKAHNKDICNRDNLPIVA